MNHEPRPAVHMEKELRWAEVSGDLQSKSNIVSQIDGVSDMAPAYWLCEGRVIKGTMASAHLDTRQFCSSYYAAAAFQAATPVLELRGSESELVSPFVCSLRGTAWYSSSFFH